MSKSITILTLDISLKGGIERVVSNMANMFHEYTDYHVTIVSVFSRFGKPFFSFPDDVEVKFLTREEYNLTSLSSKIKSNIIIADSIRKLKLRDTIVISSVTNITLWLTAFNSATGCKIIAAEHAYYWAFGAFTRYIRKRLFPKVDAVVTLTKSEKYNYESFCKKVVCIPNALNGYPEIVDINLKSKRVLSAGRAVIEKNYDKLLQVYNRLAQRFQDWSFEIYASDGYLLDDLKEQACSCLSNVVLHPATDKLQKEMLDSSIYVCSSYTESFSMVILEAMSCGMCSISYDCPSGPRELISNNIDGRLVELNNMEKLYATIAYYIENEKARASISSQGRMKARSYLPESICKIWVDLFNQL